MNTSHPVRTRQATGGGIWRGIAEQTGGTFTSRGTKVYNSLPAEIRNSRTSRYKSEKWQIKVNNITSPYPWELRAEGY